MKWYIGLSIDKAQGFSMLNEFRTSPSSSGDLGGDHHPPAGHADPLLMQPLLLMGRAMSDIAQAKAT